MRGSRSTSQARYSAIASEVFDGRSGFGPGIDPLIGHVAVAGYERVAGARPSRIAARQNAHGRRDKGLGLACGEHGEHAIFRGQNQRSVQPYLRQSPREPRADRISGAGDVALPKIPAG